VIDCGIGIDDSALANSRIDAHHRQRHDRRTRSYNSGSTHAGLGDAPPLPEVALPGPASQ
jgi:hypothetical protein